MSKASPPRTSPTMMRSGRMRSALRTKVRMGISPLFSMFGGRASDGKRWDDRVDPRAIRQPRVDERAALVDAATDRGHDAVDDVAELGFVAESHVAGLDAAPPLAEPPLRP